MSLPEVHADLHLTFILSSFIKTFYSEALLAVDTSEDKMEGQPSEAEGEWTTSGGIEGAWHTGLGQIYKYPGDPKRSAHLLRCMLSIFERASR